MALGGGKDLCSVEGDQRCPRHCTTAALFPEGDHGKVWSFH